MPDDEELQQTALSELSARCAEQSARFRRGERPDNRYCFELFRRALENGDPQAWEIVYTQYHALVAGWVRNHPQSDLAGEDDGYFVNRTFESMWQAFREPGKFARFPNLERLLYYLKSCVHTAISMHLRDLEGPSTVELSEELLGSKDSSIERNLQQREQRETLWHFINTRLGNEKERRVVESYFIFDLKPREIYNMYPTVFRDVQEVYRVKQNLLERLRRDPEIGKFMRENA